MLVLFGGLVGLDAVSCPQVMISRPLIAGAVTGAVLGDPGAGLWVGLILELLTLRQLPIGAARQWDAGLGGLAGAVTYLIVPMGRWEGLVAGVLVGVTVAWLGGWSMHGLRHLNARLVAGLAGGTTGPTRLGARHLGAMSLDFLRGSTITAVAMLGITRFARILPEGDGGGETIALIGLLAVVGFALGGLTRTLVAGLSAWVAFVGGAFGGLALWLWLG